MKEKLSLKNRLAALAAHERLYLALCFLLPTLLTWLIYIAMECYPFGENSVLVLDLNGQYVSFFEYLRSLIYSGDSLAYSWERALGGEFMGIYAYYLASPFSLIVALFPKRMITEALLTIILLKAGSAGFAMGLYLDTNYKGRKLNIVLFSTMYAVCAYMVVMGHNTMWVDELIILPFLCLGVERFIRRKGCLLYVSSLALACIVNFYIGYMMCIFTFFFFIYRYFSYTREERNPSGIKGHLPKTVLLAVVYTAVAVSIAAVIIMQAYYALTFGKTTFSDPDFKFEQRFDFLDLIVKMIPGAYDTVRPEGLPWVYCGTLAIVMLPLFFIVPNKVIKVREKLFAGAALLFFVFSFNSSTIDIAWHGFQEPNWLNYRYSFMFCFAVLVYAYRAFEAMLDGHINVRAPIAVCGALLLVIFLVQKFAYEYVGDLDTIWVSTLIVCGFMAAIGVLKSFGWRMGGQIFLSFAVIVEMTSVGLLELCHLNKDVVFTSRTTYRTYMDRWEPFIDSVTATDDSFYRLEKSEHRKTNDPMAIGYKGTSNSTSTLNAPAIRFLNRLGFASQSHWSKHLGGTPVSDSLLGMKYLIFDSAQETKFYELYSQDETEGLYAYLNPYALSVAFAADPAIETLDPEEFDTPFELMNAMVTAILGEDDEVELFKKIRATDTDYDNIDITYVTGHKKYSPEISGRAGKMTFKIKGVGMNDEMFMYMPTEYPRECSVMVNGESYGNILGNDSACVKSLGFREKGEELLISVTLEEEECYVANGGAYFWYLDTAAFEEYMPRLAEGNFVIDEWSETRLHGTINVPADRAYLYTTIPYDEGWQITLDGEPLTLAVATNALIGAAIPEGEHTVEFKYSPKSLRYGMITTVSGLLAYAALLYDELAPSKKRKETAAVEPTETGPVE